MRFFILTLLFLIANLVFSQEKSLLWEITGKDLIEPSYLYGTIHIKDKRVFRFSDSLEYVFKRSQIFAGEMVLDNESKRSAAKDVMMPGDTTLEMLIGKENYLKVKKRAKKKLFLISGMVNRLKPIFTLSIITQDNFKNQKKKMLDEHFQDLAKKNDKKIIGLETVQEQMASLNKISLKEQADMLLEEINNPPQDVQDEADELVNLYLSQDIDGLIESIPTDSANNDFGNFIINERNHKMVERIIKLIHLQSAFIAIGAAHLGGNEGIINLLKNKGYNVRPMKSTFKK